VKRVLLADGLLELEIPVDWVVRAPTLANDSHVEVAVPPESPEWVLGWVPEGLTTIVYRTTAAAHEFAEALMRRRVANGEPERFDDLLGTVPALGYEWTDGIHDIATWFVKPTDDVAVEILVTLPGLSEPSGRYRDPIARGRTLLCSARWIK
jgi:hypothetical protein